MTKLPRYVLPKRVSVQAGVDLKKIQNYQIIFNERSKVSMKSEI